MLPKYDVANRIKDSSARARESLFFSSASKYALTCNGRLKLPWHLREQAPKFREFSFELVRHLRHVQMFNLATRPFTRGDISPFQSLWNCSACHGLSAAPPPYSQSPTAARTACNTNQPSTPDQESEARVTMSRLQHKIWAYKEVVSQQRLAILYELVLSCLNGVQIATTRPFKIFVIKSNDGYETTHA
jgi:hypothetical protein